jgi:hypothetical protein
VRQPGRRRFVGDDRNFVSVIEWTLMGDEDPEDAEPPTDDSFLLGATGVEEQVLAELARAEANMNDPEETADDSDGAVV